MTNPLLLVTALLLPLASAQQVLVTPHTWQDALAACNINSTGGGLYPPPHQYGETWIYSFVRGLPEPVYWIQRRGGTTCTAVPNDAADLGDLEEFSCDGESFPAICN